jgi:hypothetical protein
MMKKEELVRQRPVVYVKSDSNIYGVTIREVYPDSHPIKGNNDVINVRITFSDFKPEFKTVTSDRLFPDAKAANKYIAIQKSPGAH